MKLTLTFLFTLALTAAPWMVDAQALNLTFNFSQPAQLAANAGVDSLICIGQSLPLGGNPSVAGGTGPYSYAWSPATNLTDSSLANPVANPTDTTTYSLTVTDANGCTATDAILLNVDVCISNDIPGLASVEIYPNPSRGTFQLNASLMKQVEQFQIAIYDISGKEVYRSSKTNPEMLFTHQVTLPGVARGIYVLKMDFDGVVLDRKIIVQ
jgi:hypothetical protein